VILDLEIENFLSVRDAQRIDLVVGSNEIDRERSAPAWPQSDQLVSKVVAFFGPNASGKSTVLKVLPLLAWFIKSSFQLEPSASLPFEPFADEANAVKPTRFSVSFPGPNVVPENGRQADSGFC
jgi:AAA15 family ATPase/GTPase